MLCLFSFTLPLPNGFCQRTSPFILSTHQRDKLSPSATFRKIRSRQTMGVEPLTPGMATFQRTFSSVVHLTGRFFSLLRPLRLGPRHCGQFSACTTAKESSTRARTPRVRFRIFLILQLKLLGSSLCNLCVLCVSVVNSFINHRDTEYTEYAQRKQITTLLGEPVAGASAKRPAWPRAMRSRLKAEQRAVTDRARDLGAVHRARGARAQSRAERKQNPQPGRSKASGRFP